MTDDAVIEREEAWADGPAHLRAFVDEAGLATVRAAAAAEGVDATHWAVANGRVSEDAAYRAVARRLGLRFAAEAPPTPCPSVLPDRAGFERAVRQRATPDGRALIAPTDDGVEAWRERLAHDPMLADDLVVTTPSASREGLTRDLAPLLMREAVDGLSERAPHLSARTLRTHGGWALAALGLLAATFLFFAFGLWPDWLARAVNVTGSLVFAFFVAARLAIALDTRVRDRRAAMEAVPPAPEAEPEGAVPFYTLLVALHREGNQVRDLVAALDALRWPRARREIVLVCEADDHETLDALATLTLPADARVVAVPAGEPRTKPKALLFALPTCRGDIVVLYDAEDRPDPLQLHEAWAAFRTGSERLACVQAPLHIANASDGLLPKLFAAEYSALFDSLLPALAERGGPVPLGGTSNHFRREALDDVGAWDGWNVTEDADLGLRLARGGWEVGVIARATAEEAPVRLVAWTKQRTRWFKGWMQTWLVHMREPGRLWHELGARTFANFHLFITGMLVSALVHPLFITSALASGATLWLHGWDGPDSALHRALLSLDIAVIVFGYAAFAFAAWRTMGLRGLSHLRPWLLLVPFYWILMSAAAWRALWQLHTAPSVWEKTPHEGSRG